MADNNENNYFEDEADEDLLTTIRRWTEKTQRENESKRGQWPQEDPDSRYINSNGPNGPPRNPWEANAAGTADRAPHEPPPAPAGYTPVRVREAQPVRPMAPVPVYEKKPGRDKPARKKRPVRRVLATLLALVLLLGAGGYALAFAMAGKVDSQPLSGEDRAALFAATGTTRVTNILLMGMDTEDGGRSDTMLLLSVDRVHRKLKLTSFLRDSWVKLPNGKSNRINTAVFYGGPAMAMRTVSENFDVRVDHYVMADFDVFEKIVDALGGVSVPIEKNEINFLCKYTRLGKQIGKEEMQRQMKPDNSGAVKLNGEQALIFCRIRKLDSDFQRTARQRRFLDSLIQACKKNPLRLLGLMGDVLSYVKTDMTQAQMANLAAMAPLLLGYDLAEHTVPAEHTYKDTTKQGMSVLTLDVQENAKRLRKFIYE